MKNIYLTLTSVLFAPTIFAQNVNWAEHIAPILYNKCTKCHHEGGAGHFSLTGYDYSFLMLGKCLLGLPTLPSADWLMNGF
ncbi:MAG: hypothetical protein ACOYLO_17000 [Ferruginibacter sp.]